MQSIPKQAINLRQAKCSVGGASGLGIVSRVTTLANGVGKGCVEGVVDVPQVAEVDRVVVDAHGLRSGVSSNRASGVRLSELEHLVVGVLTVLGKAGAPDVDVILLLLECVGALGGGLG